MNLFSCLVILKVEQDSFFECFDPRPDHEGKNTYIVSNECLQQSIRYMDSAFTKFFREHTGFPKFKSKHRNKNVFKNVNSVKFDFENNRVKIPIIGWIKFFANRSFEGKIGTITISKSSTGKFYASILVDDGIPNPGKFVIDPDTTEFL